MTTLVPAQCVACVRYRGDGTCDAFPTEIPDAIISFGADHREPFAGDGGLRFLLRADTDSRQAFALWQETFG